MAVTGIVGAGEGGPLGRSGAAGPVGGSVRWGCPGDRREGVPMGIVREAVGEAVGGTVGGTVGGAVGGTVGGTVGESGPPLGRQGANP